MKAGRFVVDTHVHITTLYKRKAKTKISLGGGYEYETYDNSSLCLYDMDRYGVDMCVLLPSWPGTLNEMQAMLVDKYPKKFVACCSDQTLRLKTARGEAEWTLEAALEEVESALKTGKHVGIGEFLPKNFDKKKVYTFRERLDEVRACANLAAKYNVVMCFHQWRGGDWGGGPYGGYDILSKVAGEYSDVNICLQHGGYGGSGATGPEPLKRACAAVGGHGGTSNIYMETGCWPAEYYEIAIRNPDIGVTNLVWSGCDYGNCPQYITARNQPPTGKEYAASSGTGGRKGWHGTPRYQWDTWGWALHQINRLRDWVTQDELNLILGGNAAKIFKLPVPHPRMFPSGRPDLWGLDWEKSVPFLPAEQIENPDTPQPYFAAKEFKPE